MSDTITLTKKEVEEAMEQLAKAYEEDKKTWGCFGNYDEVCWQDFEEDSQCRLCKKLTQFAKGHDEK